MVEHLSDATDHAALKPKQCSPEAHKGPELVMPPLAHLQPSNAAAITVFPSMCGQAVGALHVPFCSWQ
jgi:hypothetical protein